MRFRVIRDRLTVCYGYAMHIAKGANIRVRTLAKTDMTLLAICSVYGTVSGGVRVKRVCLIEGDNNGDKLVSGKCGGREGRNRGWDKGREAGVRDDNDSAR